MRIFAMLGVLAALFLAPMPVSAQSDTAVFSALEKQIIKQFFEAAGVNRPGNDDKKCGKKAKKAKKYKNKGRGGGPSRGRAKRGGLPPGLAKRQQLPPGLSKSPLPPALRAKLPKPPKGVERAVVDGNIVLIREGANILLDVLEDVLAK